MAKKTEAIQAKSNDAKTSSSTKKKPSTKSKTAAKSKSAKSQKNAVSRQEFDFMVKQRAYEIFMERGCNHGEHENDWYQAENEVKSNVKILN